jgi:hypothetical protein
MNKNAAEDIDNSEPTLLIVTDLILFIEINSTRGKFSKEIKLAGVISINACKRV